MGKNSEAPTRTLVVDDEESNPQTVGSILRSQRYAVLAAKSGEEAIATAASGRPDVILLDVQMPVMDGYETAHSLSSQEQTSSIPIVMVTGLTGLDERVRALRAGAVRPAGDKERLRHRTQPPR